MRLVTGIALIDAGVTKLWGGPPFGPTILCVIAAVAGVLLIVGLWTPVAGLLLVVIEVWKAFSHPGDPWTRILLATLSAALALLGPGAWSVDAYLFGWKRIDIRDRKS
jgi:uncharacterized membrane protein YphA (DoxX/SURF4 family)